MIPRVVIDTNLYFSGFFYGGLPGKLLLQASEGKLHPLISSVLIDELRRKFLSRFDRPPAMAESYIQELLEISSILEPAIEVKDCRDPDDNRILECAVSGAADAIITGDKDLLVLHPFRGIPILTVRQFLDSLPA